MRWKVSILLITLVLFTQLSYADEVLLKNGDHLTGKIIKLVDGKMIFKSDLSGEVTVGLANIQTLGSDEPITVNLKDGTALQQKIVRSQAGRFSISGDETIKAQEFSVGDIISINPPVPKWTGNLSAGLTSTHGNTKTENITGSADLKKRTDKDRTTISADYAKGKQDNPDTGENETIEDWWRARTKYDYFFSKKMYGYLDGRYEKDAVAELDRRVTVGIGCGYQWIESADMNFSTELGLASLYEKYDNQTASNSEVSAQLGYNFDKKLRENLHFIHELTYYPALQKFSDYYLTTTAELRSNFTATLFMNIKAIMNYDNTPAIGSHKTDVKYFLGLGYSF
jgi:putative salt-induced outer membrane protein YdiY